MADEVSKELEWLREMRQYAEASSKEQIGRQWEQIAAFEQSGRAESIDGRRQLLQMLDDVHRDSETAKLYKIILNGAAKAEREEKGGAVEYLQQMRKTVLRRLAEIYNA